MNRKLNRYVKRKYRNMSKMLLEKLMSDISDDDWNEETEVVLSYDNGLRFELLFKFVMPKRSDEE